MSIYGSNFIVAGVTTLGLPGSYHQPSSHGLLQGRCMTIALQTHQLVLLPKLTEVTLFGVLTALSAASKPQGVVDTAVLCGGIGIGDSSKRQLCPESHSLGYNRERCLLSSSSLSSPQLLSDQCVWSFLQPAVAHGIVGGMARVTQEEDKSLQNG